MYSAQTRLTFSSWTIRLPTSTYCRACSVNEDIACARRSAALWHSNHRAKRRRICFCCISVYMVLGSLAKDFHLIRDDPTARYFLEWNQNCADNMLRLITYLLDLARIETGLSLSLSLVPFAAFLRDCVANLELQAKDTQIA